MQDRTIYPSMKTVYAAYVLAVIIILAGVWAYYAYGQEYPKWLMAIPLIALLPPLRMHIKRRLISLRLHDDHLTIESGFFSRTRRTLDLAKVQDVTVRQGLGQRLLGVGDLMLETAGEAGAVGISNLDGPRALADEIIAGSRRSGSGRL
jgi:putative membrane protein